jgi:RNA polymerase sigma factor (sigma-70 family)
VNIEAEFPYLKDVVCALRMDSKTMMMSTVSDEWLPTRQSLLSRLKDWEDQESWREFFETYWRLIYRVAVKAGLSDDEAQDVVQETVISLAKQMSDFRYDRAKGSFKVWLLKLTQWRISDRLRKRHRECASVCTASNKTEVMEAMTDSEAAEALEKTWDEEWKRNLTERAFESLKKHVSPRQIQIFQLHVFHRWPVQKIMAELKIGRAAVYLAKHRVGGQLKKEVARLRSKYS